MTIKEAQDNIGAEVMYIPYIGCPKSQIEFGTITRVNEKYVFVNFAPRTMGRGEACRPEDLKLAQRR